MDSPLSHVLPEPGLTATLYRGIAPVSAGVQTLAESFAFTLMPQHFLT